MQHVYSDLAIFVGTLDLSSTLKFNTYFFEILEGLRAPFQKMERHGDSVVDRFSIGIRTVEVYPANHPVSHSTHSRTYFLGHLPLSASDVCGLT